MKYTLMESLMGKDSEVHPIHPLQKDVPEDEVVEAVRDILGSKDKYIAKVLSTMALSHHYTWFNLNTRIIPVEQEQIYQDYLVSDMNGMCITAPAELENASPVFSQNLVIQYSGGAKNCLILFRGKEWIVRCRYAENRLFISWPEELGIRGALQIEDYSQNILFPIKARYPVTSVVEKLKVSTPVQELLERTNLFHEFFFSDTGDEAIGIVVLALYKYMNDVI